MRLIDLTAEINGGMPKPPSAPEVKMEYILSQSKEEEERKGYSNKLEQFTITTHVGTHLDAPSHFTADGKNIDELPLEIFYRIPTLVLSVEKEEYGEITVEDLERAQEETGEIRSGDFVILNTGFYKQYGQESYLHPPYLTEASAVYLADAGISLLGTDCFTVDDVRIRERPAHIVLLKKRGIPIVEGVANLDLITAPRLYCCCFPIKIREGSGGFTRLIGIYEEET